MKRAPLCNRYLRNHETHLEPAILDFVVKCIRCEKIGKLKLVIFWRNKGSVKFMKYLSLEHKTKNPKAVYRVKTIVCGPAKKGV